MRFSTFLNESPHKQSIDLETAIDIVKKNCMKSIDVNLWRGGGYSDKLYLLDSSKTVRRSANTGNHYTLIMDHFNAKNNLPLRSRAFICSGSKDIAEQFGSLMRLIPFDNAQIGNTGEDDLFYVPIHNKHLKSLDFEMFASIFSIADIPATSFDAIVDGVIAKLNKLKELDKIDDNDQELFILFKDVEYTKEGITNKLKALFDPDNLGFKFYTGATATGKLGRYECWVSGKCLVVTPDMYDEIKKAVK